MPVSGKRKACDGRGATMLVLVVVTCICVCVCTARYRGLEALGVRVHSAPCARVLGSRRPHLFICTHDYEHIDLFHAAKRTVEWHACTGCETSIVMAPHAHNRLFDALVSSRASAIFVRSGTVRKVLHALQKRNVCFFLYRQTPETGAYHIIRQFDGPVVLMALRSETCAPCSQCGVQSLVEAARCVRHSVGARFVATYEQLSFRPDADADADADGLDEPSAPGRYMRRLIDMLYAGGGHAVATTATATAAAAVAGGAT